jgi:hypothetical protein
MNGRDALEANEQREEIFRAYNYRCAVCGESIYQNGCPQLAHCIARTIPNIKKYGVSVINHKMNMKPVCGLFCNDKCNIGFCTAEAEELADKIRDELLKE